LTNLYSYVGSNPICLKDPTGLIAPVVWVLIAGTAGGIAGAATAAGIASAAGGDTGSIWAAGAVGFVAGFVSGVIPAELPVAQMTIANVALAMATNSITAKTFHSKAPSCPADEGEGNVSRGSFQASAATALILGPFGKLGLGMSGPQGAAFAADNVAIGNAADALGQSLQSSRPLPESLCSGGSASSMGSNGVGCELPLIWW
jgi:hypothetical protein